MLDFPATPASDQLFNASNGVVYKWVTPPGMWMGVGSITPTDFTGTGKYVLQTSPELLGVPLTTTATLSDDSKQIANTAWVRDQGFLTSMDTRATVLTLAKLKEITAPYPEVVTTACRTTAGDGGGGVWTFRSGDQSVNVTADTRSGLWAAPNSAPTGSAGAWQRQFEGAVSVLWFGAVADGVTDDLVALNAAIASGGKEIYFPAGKYRIVGNGYLNHPGNQHWVGAGMGRTIIEKQAAAVSPGGYGVVRALGTYNTTQGNTVSIMGAQAGSTTFALIDAAHAANFTAGDIALLVDETENFPGISGSSKQGEFVTIRRIVGDTIDVLAPLQYSYWTAATAQLMKVTWLRGVQISDMSFTNTVNTDPNGALAYFGLCMEPRIMNCSAYYGTSQGFTFSGCYQARATVEVYDLLSDNILFYYGYGVLEAGINLGGQFNITAARVRHAYTTGGGSPGGTIPRVVLTYGMPTSTVITGTSTDSYTTSWDTHLDGHGITFLGCSANGSAHPGIQFRCRSGAAIGCHIVKTVGAGIYINSEAPLGGATDTLVSGCTFDRTNCGINTFEDGGVDWRERGAIEDRGIRTTVRNCTTTNSGGAGIIVQPAARDPVYRDIRIVNPCRLSTTIRDGISALATTTTSLRIDSADIRCTDTRMLYGIRTTSANLDALITGASVYGAFTAPIETHATAKVWGGTMNGPVSFGPHVTATIVGGVLNITNITSGMISVIGEGDANDDLVTITSTADSASIMLRQGGAGIITVKSTGNITSPAGADVFLGTSRFLMLTRLNGTTWIMTSLA